ncbi:MAG: ABC transporter permease [Albidovulum sp.]|nr:ABC transporter permease [Albidovulum sp.]MDE0304479.1 ABC transporter permease [Albidovulum sp.]
MTGPSAVARGILGLVFSATAAVIYLPIIVMIVFSFNSGRYQVMPFREFTLGWYRRTFQDIQYLEGLANSLAIAACVSATATVIAFICAYSLVNSKFPGKTAVTLFVLAPLAVPLILIGISLRIYFVSIGLEPSLALVFVGQVLYVLPLAVLNIRNRIAQIPRSQEEAAWALGASRTRTILEIVVPSCKFSILATLIITFTFAFDEFVIAYFLTNFSITLPIKIWTTLVTGFDPAINAVGVMVFGFSIASGIVAQALFMRKDKRT